MPVMPASASAAMSTLRVSRTAIWVVWIEVASRCGWPIWTAMKIAPAAAAAAPAALVRLLLVTFMVAPGSRWRTRCPADVPDARSRLGEATSQDDVIGLVILPGGRLQQAELACAGDCRPAGVHPELGKDMPGVRAEGVDGHEQPAGDLGPGQVGCEQPQHRELALAESFLGGGSGGFVRRRSLSGRQQV